MTQNSSTLTASPLSEVLQHWAEARIDTPLNLVGRYDEGARQVLALTAALQAAYVAVLSFGDLGSAAHAWPRFLVVLFLIPAMFFALRCICTVPAQMEAMGAYQLIEAVTAGRATPDDVKQAVHLWCVHVDSLVAKKRWLLHAGNLAFLIGSVLASLTILYLIMP